MRDQSSRLAHNVPYFPAVLNATPANAAIDRRGFESLTLLLLAGIGGITFTGSNRIDWTITHSDDGTNYTAVTTGDIVGSDGSTPTLTGGVVESYIALKAAASTTHYGYIGDRRFVRCIPVFGGTHATGTLVGAVGVLGNPANSPAN